MVDEVICNTNALGRRLILEDLAAAKEKYGLDLLAKEAVVVFIHQHSKSTEQVMYQYCML